jgi:YesN/AraC family two-component response regulator
MIVACTGHSENEYILKAWRHSIDEVLPKPTNLNILKEILGEII